MQVEPSTRIHQALLVGAMLPMERDEISSEFEAPEATNYRTLALTLTTRESFQHTRTYAMLGGPLFPRDNKIFNGAK